MAVIAREPLAFAPLAGPDESDSLFPAFPPQKPFLHVIGGFDSGASPEPSATQVIKVILSSAAAVSGAVLASAAAADGPYISEISFEGMSFAVPETRPIQVPGNFGTLTLNAAGGFSYAPTGHEADFTDVFLCTARGAAAPPLRITLEIESQSQQFELPLARAS